jgi:hypothetical protein
MRLLLAILVPVFLAAGCASSPPKPPVRIRSGGEYRLLFPEVSLQSGERIVALHVKLSGVYLRAVSNIPPDWSVDAPSPISEQMEFDGSCAHGASALFSIHDLDAMLRFCVIDSESFDVSAEIVVTVDFDKTRSIVLTRHELVLQPVTAKVK